MGENALAGWPTLWALGHARTSWPLEYRPFGTSRVGGLTSFLLRTLSHRYVAHGCKLMGSKTELASLQRVPILSTCRLCENTFPTYLLSRATFTGFLNNSWTVGKTLKILRVHRPPCATFSLEWVLERRDSTRIQRPGNSFCLITTCSSSLQSETLLGGPALVRQSPGHHPAEILLELPRPLPSFIVLVGDQKTFFP